MKFKVQVADKVTGAERSLIIDSLSREGASNRANTEGFLVSSVEPMLPADAMPQPSIPLDCESLERNRGSVEPGSLAYIGHFMIGVLLVALPIGLIVTGQVFGLWGVIVGVVLIVIGLRAMGRFLGVTLADLSPDAPEQHQNLSSTMICPHCQAKGTVTTERVEMKKGVSGAKATAAVLTGGFSILATGLSRKEELTRAHCTNCANTWHF